MNRIVAAFAISLLWSAVSANAQTKLSLAKVQDLVRLVKAGDRTEQQAVFIITSSGVDFEASPDNLNSLRRTGAPPALITAIQRVAPQPVTEGALSFRCAPAECELKINGQSIGKTTNGQLVKDGLPLGQVVVDFQKDGYITKQFPTVKVTAEPPTVLAATLEPDNTTKGRFGKTLYDAMLKALRPKEGSEGIRVLSGSGALTSYVKNKQSDMDFNFAIAAASQMEMAVKNASGSLVYDCTGEKCGEKKKGRFVIGGGKQMPRPMIEELEPNLRAFAQNSLVAVLEDLSGPAVRFLAPSAEVPGKGEQHLQAEARDRSYDVTIGADMLPVAVDYQSRSGLGSGLKITFGDYIEVASGWYPRRTTVRLPDADQHGIEVRLDTVTPGSTNKK